MVADEAHEYGPKKHVAKVVWAAIYLDARSTNPESNARGYVPTETRVHVGDHVVFLNLDDQVHTATLRREGAFPPGAKKRMAHNLSGVWSTGDLKPGAESSPIFVDKAGVYTYGCVHHFGLGQHATIISEP